jgi:hypothetical protein
MLRLDRSLLIIGYLSFQNSLPITLACTKSNLKHMNQSKSSNYNISVFKLIKNTVEESLIIKITATGVAALIILN